MFPESAQKRSKPHDAVPAYRCERVTIPEAKQPDPMLLLRETAGCGTWCNAVLSGTELTLAILHWVSKARRSEFSGTKKKKLKDLSMEKVPLTLVGSTKPGPSS